MPIVNYVREHIRFMEYATDEHLTSSERLLWYALMHIMNQRAQGKVWPDEFIRISNDRLLSYCPMKFDTMANARNGLKQRGLIEFTKGEKNKLSPAYRMIYFYPQYIAPADTEQGSAEFYPENSDYMRGNMGYNTGGNAGGNMGYNDGGNMGDFYINYTGIPIPCQYQKDPEEDENEDEDSIARAHMRERAGRSWRIHFGRATTPAVLDRIVRWAGINRAEPGVVDLAIKFAAGKGAENPVDYLMAILTDWSRNNVKTVEDVDAYMPLFDASLGKLGALSEANAMEQIKAFRQDRETDQERERREAQEQREAEERAERQAMISANEQERKRAEYEHARQALDRKFGVVS